MRAKMSFFVVFISIFYIVGFGMLGYAVFSMKRSMTAANWPEVDGTIVSCDIETDSDSDGTTHEVKVNYNYTVDGLEYSNDTLAFGYSASSGIEAHQEILDKLRAAKSVRVRYKPGDPQTSVLSYGFHRSIQLVLAFAITWLLFVIGFTTLWWLSSQSDNILLQNLVTR